MSSTILNFGTSAYLKLLALNPKPRDTEIRKRLDKGGGGYDFHRQMRRIVTGHLSGLYDRDMALREIASIKNLPERNSAANALENLTSWLRGNNIRALQDCDERTVSPSATFSVKFSPDFVIDLNGKPIRVHIWNTIRPILKLREAIGIIGLFSSEDEAFSRGILSLRTGELFATANFESARELSILLARDIERRIERLNEEIDERRGYDRPGKAAFR